MLKWTAVIGVLLAVVASRYQEIPQSLRAQPPSPLSADLVKEEKDDATEKEMCETERAKNNQPPQPIARDRH